MMSLRSRVVLSVVVLPSVLLAACADEKPVDPDPAAAEDAPDPAAAEDEPTADDGDGDGDGDDAPAGVEVITSPPTELTVTEPLPAAPEPKQVAFLPCEVEACQVNVPYFTEAAEALGWEVTTTSYSFASPGSAFQQAIDAGVDYIATTGVALAQIEEQVALAQEKGIPIFECFSTDLPAGEDNGLYAQCAGSASVGVSGNVLVDWIIDDSAGSANVLMVTIRDFPINVAQEEASVAGFAERCPDCSVEVLSATIDDLGAGAVPQQVASHLQSNPDVDYVYFLFSDLSLGVSDALAAAGLDEGVSLVGVQSSAPQLEELVAGSNRAWRALPYKYAMYVLVDQMARHATGVWSAEQEQQASILPTWVIDAPDIAEGLQQTDGWTGPDGFETSFQELWGVAG